jgi:hypothetical protein
MGIRIRFREGARKRRCFRGVLFGRDGVSLREFHANNPKVARILHGPSSAKFIELVPPQVSAPAAAPEAAPMPPPTPTTTDNLPTDEAAEDATSQALPPPVEPVETEAKPAEIDPPVDRMAAARAAKAKKAADDAANRSRKGH